MYLNLILAVTALVGVGGPLLGFLASAKTSMATLGLISSSSAGGIGAATIATNAVTASITFCTGPGNDENASIIVVKTLVTFSRIGSIFVPTVSLRLASAVSNFCVAVTFFSAASPYCF